MGFDSSEVVADALERVKSELTPTIGHHKEKRETESSNIRSGYKTSDMSRLFSASYTTEIEREVMHAALNGTPLPIAQQILSGNEIELF